MGLLVIGAFKLLKSAALIAIGVGALKLLHKDLAAEVAKWFASLDLDPNNHYIMHILERVSSIDARKLKQLSIGTFVYAGIYLTEGVGLLLRKSWAEYLTIISTAGFVPLEAYEIAKRLTFTRIALLLINIAIVAYLVADLRREAQKSKTALPPEGS